MNKKTELVFNGFLKLTPQEREDFIEAWDQYRQAQFTVQKSLREDMAAKISLGPLPDTGCPCCGR